MQILMMMLSAAAFIAMVVVYITVPIVAKVMRITGIWLPLLIFIVMLASELMQFPWPLWLYKTCIGIWFLSFGYPVFLFLRGIIRFFRGEHYLLPMLDKPKGNLIFDEEDMSDDIIIHNGKIYTTNGQRYDR